MTYGGPMNLIKVTPREEKFPRTTIEIDGVDLVEILKDFERPFVIKGIPQIW
jgi:hypothetical protein